MTYVIQSNSTGWTPIATVDTAQRHPLGSRVQAADPTLGNGEFIYLKGASSTAIGTWSTINDDDGTTTRLVADAVGSVGVAMAAIDAATKYGWFQIFGKASGLAAASFADNGSVYITATAGVVDDAVVDGDLVHNALGASTIVSAGLAEFEIHYPYTDNITTND
jgi:hypothetical protein